MSTPTKIFEIKGEDFAKGLSYFTDFPIGGLYSAIGNFDPFLDYGYFTPSLGGTITDSSKTSTPKFLNTFNSSGTAKLYVHTNTKLYEVLDGSPYTTTDKSSEISVANPVVGAITFQGRYIYVDNIASIMYSNSLPVLSASNTNILSGFASTEHYKPMAIAPDKNLYMGDFGQISKVVDATSTTGNTAVYYQLEDYMAVRDLANDGHYLVAIADNNTSYKINSTGNSGSYRCQVLFYDVNSGRSTPDYIYEFTDSFLISVKILDGAVYIFGKENLWVCNSQTSPKAIFNFQTGSTITEPPQYFYQVSQKNNVIYWCGQTNQRIFAFGSKVSGVKKIFFQPYSNSSNPTCILLSGDNVYIGSNGSNAMLSVFNSSQTKSSANLTTTYINLNQPYTFAFGKIILKEKLSSGQSVSFGMNCIGGEITNFETKSYSQIGAKKKILFNKTSDAGNPPVPNFDEFNISIDSNASISKIEVWGYPIDNYEQAI